LVNNIKRYSWASAARVQEAFAAGEDVTTCRMWLQFAHHCTH